MWHSSNPDSSAKYNYCCPASKLCPTLCNPMNCSMPAFPVLHYFPEFAKTHVHWVSDALQPSHPLLHTCNAGNNTKRKWWKTQSWKGRGKLVRIFKTRDYLTISHPIQNVSVGIVFFNSHLATESEPGRLFIPLLWSLKWKHKNCNILMWFVSVILRFLLSMMDIE